MVKKILFVIGIMGNGGAERVIAALANQLVTEEVQVAIVTIYSNRQDYALDPRVMLHHITCKRKVRIFRPVERVYNLRRFIRKYEPDCVVSFLADVNIHTILACDSKRYPLIVSERNDPYRDPNQKWIRVIRNHLYKKIDGLVLQTNDAAQYFESRLPSKVKRIVIPNPITPGLPEFKGNISNNRLITACRLNKQKNLLLMIKSVREVNNSGIPCYLDIYGDGPLKKELQSYIDGNGLSDIVHLKGFSNSIHEEMMTSKAFLISSDYEGISNSMLEALAIGIPVIATDCPIGGARMFIENGQTGWLTKVGNQSEFTQAISELLQNYEKALQYGKRAMNIRITLDVSIICKKWNDFFAKILEDRKHEQ